jgi:aryl-alcohol dehydrogenase-like predicted oxidoreductase
MEMRMFGRIGLELSVLGCLRSAGLMVRADPIDQERTIARAFAAGVNYFDTAAQYGMPIANPIATATAYIQSGVLGERAISQR